MALNNFFFGKIYNFLYLLCGFYFKNLNFNKAMSKSLIYKLKNNCANFFICN